MEVCLATGKLSRQHEALLLVKQALTIPQLDASGHLHRIDSPATAEMKFWPCPSSTCRKPPATHTTKQACVRAGVVVFGWDAEGCSCTCGTTNATPDQTM
ncbi:unnamed protein product [Ectocarpus fasciculatus]